MKSRLANKSAFKFQKFNMERAQYNLSKKSLGFKTHTIVQSIAEILIPSNMQFNKLQDLIAMITCNDVVFWAQISDSSFADKNIEEISILQNLVNIAGLQIQGGYLKGQIKFVDKQKIPEQYHLQYAQVVVKNIYVSRRDQYKIIKYLERKPIHVYNRKTVYFHKLKLEFNNFINKKGQISKSGIVDKNTKLIFRTTCSKYTILLEISEEMFELNQQKQLYFQKAIEFLTLFFLRNNFFQTNHRIQIVLFARVFYPHLKTLMQAQQALKFHQQDKKAFFATNFASALQKDHNGKIHQDFYRRILWRNNQISGFRHIFSYKVSEFIFSMNVKDSNSYSKYIKKSINQAVSKSEDVDQYSIHKPYLHQLQGQLSSSLESCYFEAISLISEQFKHHYIFRSLEETGNTIMLVSAGKSMYNTDLTTYKMAKSNIYLTNIHSIAINLRRKDSTISVNIHNLEKKPLYTKNDAVKLYKLVSWCQEQDAYQTPTSIKIQFPSEKFELKSKIYIDDMMQISKQDAYNILNHVCQKEHFINKEKKKVAYTTKLKNIQWIKTIYVNDKTNKAHNIFYDHLAFDWLTFISKKHYDEDQQLTDFERDLKIIANKKKDYEVTNFCQGTKTQKYLATFLKKLRIKNEIKEEQQRIKNQYQEQFMTKLFNNSNINQQKITPSPAWNGRKLSKQDIVLTPQEFVESPRSYKAEKMFRKSSDPEIKDAQGFFFGQTTNIFQETYKRGEFLKLIHQEIKFIQIPKTLSHNKQRLKKNYPASPIHYMMTYFKEEITDQLNNFINTEKEGKYWKIDQASVNNWFIIERQWKDIVFPVLTPIYTSFAKKQDNGSQQRRDAKYSKSGQFVIEDQICKYLMQNFQIQERSYTNVINMSKGHVKASLYTSSNDNVMTFEAIDTMRQDQIVPKLFYRYLAFQEKDSRFGPKFIAFSDQNFYLDKVKNPKKSVKLLLMEKSGSSSDLNCIQEFINYLHEKYPNIQLQIDQNKDHKKAPNIFRASLNLVDCKNSIYRSEIIELKIDTSYNPKTFFNFIIQWDNCCAVYINEFINHLNSIAWKSKIAIHHVSKAHAFNTMWNLSTIGQIIFESSTGIQLLKNYISQQKIWLWDYEGYYMDRKGNAFIRFIDQKNLIQWRDNNMDKKKWKKYDEKQQFLSFFLMSTAYDILGGLIDSINF